MKSLFLSTILLLSCSGYAEKISEAKPKVSALVETKTYLKDLDLPILKGSKIKVLNYNSQFKVYQVISINHPAEGFAYTKLDFIKNASKGLNFKALKEDPKNLLNQNLTLTQDLKTLYVPHDFGTKSFSDK